MFATLFPSNAGVVDRALRVVLGITILSLAFIGPKTAWGYIGLVPLITAFVGSCPVYTVFGISTCPLRTKAS